MSEDNPSVSTVFVGDLSVFCTESDLGKLFSPFGALQEVRIIRENKSNQPLFYGFVEFQHAAAAEQALSLHGTLFMGRSLRVCWATTPVSPRVASRSMSRSSSSKSRSLGEQTPRIPPTPRMDVVMSKSTDSLHMEKSERDDGAEHFVEDALTPLETLIEVVESAETSSSAVPTLNLKGVSLNGHSKAERRAALIPTVQILFSFITNQVDMMVTEEFIREVFGTFGQLSDVCIKKIKINKGLKTQNGYGFVHYTCDRNGVQAALQAVSCFHKRVVQHVKFDCKISHQFQQFLNDEQNAKMLAFPAAMSMGPSPLRDDSHAGWLGDAASVCSSMSHGSHSPQQPLPRQPQPMHPHHASQGLLVGASGFAVHPYSVPMMYPGHPGQQFAASSSAHIPHASGFPGHVPMMTMNHQIASHAQQHQQHHHQQQHVPVHPAMLAEYGAVPMMYVGPAAAAPVSSSQHMFVNHALQHGVQSQYPHVTQGLPVNAMYNGYQIPPQQQQQTVFPFAQHVERQIFSQAPHVHVQSSPSQLPPTHNHQYMSSDVPFPHHSLPSNSSQYYRYS